MSSIRSQRLRIIDRRPGIALIACLWLALIVLCTPALAQVGGGQAGDLGDRISQLQDRVNALGSRDDVESAVREHATQIYQQAISALEAAKSDESQTQALREQSSDAPGDLRRIKAEIAGLEPPPSPESLDGVSSSSLAERADTLSSQLADTQASLSDVRDQLTRLAQRPEAARQELLDARDALQSLDSAASADSDQPSVVSEARRALLSARREALTAEIERLQQELSGLDSRERLLEARRGLAEARLGRDNEALATVQVALGSRQNESAKALEQQSHDKLSELRTAVEPIADAAQRNVELTGELSTLTDRTEALAQRQLRERERVEEIQRRLNLVQRQLEIGGGSIALGDVLRAQRRDLAKPSLVSGLGSGSSDPDIAAAELQRFQLQQSRVALDDPRETARRMLQESGVKADDGELASLTSLIDSRRQIIDLLTDSQGRYIDIGRDLRSLSKQYNDTLVSFNRLLDERLFWLPSFDHIDLGWPGRVLGDLPWVLNPLSWKAALGGLAIGVGKRPFVTAIAAVLLAMLVWVRRPLRERLSHLAEPVGNVRRDTFWLTLRALLITILLSTPVVAVLLLAGYLVGQASDTSAFTRAVAAVLVQLGILTLFIEPFAQVCRKYGLAESHFQWGHEARRGLHRLLRWVLAMLVLPTLLVTFTEAFDDDAKRETIGRGAFMLFSLIITGFFWRLLHPVRGVLSHVLGSDDSSHWRLGYLWLPLAVGAPIVLAGMAAFGYYYTALQLQSRFFYSAGLLGGCMILYSLIVRWLTVAERRLAFARALRKREEAREARASREAAAAAGEGAPDNLDTLEIDLVQISEQTRGLIKVVIALLIGAGLWLIWSDTLPALQLLDNVTLWQHTDEIDGKTQLTSVTLGAVLLALAVGVVTALAGRNLPGFLEITVLRRFSMDSGSRYAMATLFQYAIVIVGLLISVNLIGLRWGSIQWLVAAVGVGLGFGLQEIFANFVSGIVILFERPVRVGDTVTVGTLTGTVSRIRIRATTVTDWDNKEVVIPNKTFITETVINWTLTDDITRLIVKVHLALDTDTELAEKLIMDVIRAEPVALETPAPSVFFVGYDDSAILYEARVFYHDLYNLLPLQHALYKGIHAAFSRNDVVVSFPQRDLHLRSVDDSLGRFVGDRDARADTTDERPSPG
ncbi:mechanosensitive ion channel domain-containing protein [Salinisphaera sp. T31B1]|uniref:mechanosensitive ion channel domain-containing protein n=1 Tax=Salinisphaera sp. T31B1 TaxID=727963 RepID=UPI00333FF8A6